MAKNFQQKDPAFLFYSSDFLTGTMLMSDEEVGQYIRLMCLQHQKGHLREKDLLKVCDGHSEEVFAKFEQDDEGLYFNPRLEETIQQRKKDADASRENGRRGGRPRSKPDEETQSEPNQEPKQNLGVPSRLPNKEPKPNLTEDEIEDRDINTSTGSFSVLKDTHEESNEVQSCAKDKPSPPREIDQVKAIFAEHADQDAELSDAFAGFLEMRRKINKPVTARAARLLLTELYKLGDKDAHAALLNQSTLNSWASVYPLKDQRTNGYRSGLPPDSTIQGVDPRIRRLQEFIDREGNTS